MTIDDRLDRLTERHEALTQTVELIAHQQLRNEEQLGKFQAEMLEVKAVMKQVVESIGSLAEIAHSHERRISDLED